MPTSTSDHTPTLPFLSDLQVPAIYPRRKVTSTTCAFLVQVTSLDCPAVRKSFETLREYSALAMLVADIRCAYFGDNVLPGIVLSIPKELCGNRWKRWRD